ncbi:MAG: SPASM domain-containing protein [Deltaproteobacteria bacterium]|nr:MAG: SPASM domain-containing protein [Deltaproteobacteria bacterium]
MAIDRLDAPLRLTWTLRTGSLDAQAIELLARRIARAGVFFVTLRGDFAVSRELDSVAGILRHAGVQTSLVLEPHALDGFDAPEGLAVLLDLTGLLLRDSGRRTFGEVEARLAGATVAGLSMVPLRPLLVRVPELLDFAGRMALPLHLPNVPLVDDPDHLGRLLPGARDLLGLADALARSDRSAWPQQVVAHDLFLWDLLFPGRDRDQYIGCQAGNSIAHIDADAVLHPCISWPQPLGCLLEDDLVSLWQTSGRQALLQGLETPPSGCGDCAVLNRCHGGCRGLVQARGSEDSPDLMCPGPRPADRQS